MCRSVLRRGWGTVEDDGANEYTLVTARNKQISDLRILDGCLFLWVPDLFTVIIFVSVLVRTTYHGSVDEKPLR